MSRTLVAVIFVILAIFLVWLIVLTTRGTSQQGGTGISLPTLVPSPTVGISPTGVPTETTPMVSPTSTPLPTRHVTLSPTVKP